MSDSGSTEQSHAEYKSRGYNLKDSFHDASPCGGFASQLRTGVRENYGMEKTVRCSGNLNSRGRLSVFADFMQSLNVLNGVWSRLNYIRELREVDGKYRHWGLAQTHGEVETNRAIAEVHSELHLQLLRSPLQEVFEQLPLGADEAGCSSLQLAEQLCEERERLMPDDLRGGSPKHFDAVLKVTKMLAKRSKK